MNPTQPAHPRPKVTARHLDAPPRTQEKPQMTAKEVVDTLSMRVPDGYTTRSWQLLVQDYYRLHGAVMSLVASYYHSNQPDDRDDRTAPALLVACYALDQVTEEICHAIQNTKDTNTGFFFGSDITSPDEAVNLIEALYRPYYDWYIANMSRPAA